MSLLFNKPLGLFVALKYWKGAPSNMLVCDTGGKCANVAFQCSASTTAAMQI